MYELGLKRNFIARHHIPDGPPGERQPHSHEYIIEARLQGEGLDGKGYLMDVVELKHSLDALLEKYHDQYLNTLPDLKSLNPSMENVARVVCEGLKNKIRTANLKSLEIRVWESHSAWAGYRISFLS